LPISARIGWLFRKNLKSRTFWRILRRLKDLYKVSGMPVIPTLIPISKVVRKPGLVVRKIEKVGRKSSNCRRFFRGTFHAGGHFPGRSCLFPGDLPCQRPFSRKVLPFSGGPSTLEAWLLLFLVDYPFQVSNLVRGLEVLLEGFIGTG
jgi:hypothetical protein